MLISSAIPDIEIRRSDLPVALVLSGGAVKPLKIQARANQFVINNNKVRGIYNINIKYRYLWDDTNVTCTFYTVQESNPIDPIMINKINKWMGINSIIKLRLKDVKHGIQLRQLLLHRELEDAIESLKHSEIEQGQDLDQTIELSKKKIDEITLKLKEQYSKEVNLTPEKKCIILVQALYENKKIDLQELANFKADIANKKYTFESIIDSLKELHKVTIIQPISTELEKFIIDLSNQDAEQWAGLTQDLTDTKNGLYEMLSKPISSFLSIPLSVPASLFRSFLKNIEFHYSKPVLLFAKQKRIYPRNGLTKHRYFVLNNDNLHAIVELDDNYQFMWQKASCFIFDLDENKEADKGLILALKKYSMQKKLLDKVKQKDKKTIQCNNVLEYLVTLNKIDQATYYQLYDEMKKGMKFNEFVIKLNDLGLINIIRPLNLDVKGFINDLGSQNSQEWAGFTQDLRNIKKDITDMTKIPKKSFLSFGIILGVGFVIVMLLTVVLSHPGTLPGIGGGKGFLGLGLGGKFIDILHSTGWITSITRFFNL